MFGVFRVRGRILREPGAVAFILYNWVAIRERRNLVGGSAELTV